MKFRIRFAEQVVGIFVLLGIAFLAFVLILMGINQRWFAKDYNFTSRFPSGNGLNVGMPIKFKGFEIGQVDKIVLEENNTVGIRFHIFDTYIDKVHPDSVLELASSPLGLGGGLLFHPGKGDGPHLPEGSYIPSINMPDGRKLVREGLVEIPPNTDTVNRIIGEVGPVLHNVNKTLASLNTLVGTLNSSISGEGSGPVGSLVRNASDLTSQATVTLAQTTVRINKLLDNLDAISTQLSVAAASPEGPVRGLLKPQGSLETILNDNNALFDRLTSTLDSINQTIQQLNGFIKYLNNSQPQITGILEQGRQTLQQGTDVLEGLKNNPLLRGGIPSRIPQSGTHQGYRDQDF